MAKWTYARFDSAAFSELQTHRGSKKELKIKDEKLDKAVELRAAGLSIRQIAEQLQLEKSTISDWLKVNEVSGSHIR